MKKSVVVLFIAALAAWQPGFAEEPICATCEGNQPGAQLPKIAVSEVKNPVLPSVFKAAVPPPPEKQDKKHDEKQPQKQDPQIQISQPPYSISPAIAAALAQNIVAVMPETTTFVEMSSSDVNRVVCVGDNIRDVVYSKEKNITVKTEKSNAFVKFLITKKENKETYASNPSEFFIICGDSVYSLIVLPKKIPSQTVRLVTGIQRVKKNIALFAGMPFEEKIIAVAKQIYMDEIPETYTVDKSSTKIDAFKEIDLTLFRTIKIEGEGINIKEYRATGQGISGKVELHEKDFLSRKFGSRIVAIMIDKLKIQKGDTARILVIEYAGGLNE